MHGDANLNIRYRAGSKCYAWRMDTQFTRGGLLFEWDSAKFDENNTKHGVDFRDAAAIFCSEHPPLFLKRLIENGEVRSMVAGVIYDVAVIAVVNYRDDPHRVRMISVRVASKKERASFSKQIAKYGH